MKKFTSSTKLISTVFSISIFIGAYLLFQIQPLISKFILPWFGGTSSVWSTAILFFQLLLFLGYLYVVLLSKIPIKIQIIIHAILLTLGVSTIAISLNHHSTPILPDPAGTSHQITSPTIQILFILTSSIGLTYFILSTTSVLLQKWYSLIIPRQTPYIFYALSNTASLLALISYPFIIEPHFGLSLQALNWSQAYIIYSIFLLISSLLVFINTAKPINIKKENTKSKEQKPTKTHLFLWILIPALTSLLLLSITNQITQSVTPVPFLWVLPLSLYLLSFILAFSGKKWHFSNIFAYIFIFTNFITLSIISSNFPTLIIGTISYSLLLFSGTMICHNLLYNLKPTTKHLDLFYLLISLGSVISAIFVIFIAQIYFKGVWELHIGIYLTFLIAIWTLTNSRNSLFSKKIFDFVSTKKEIYLLSATIYPIALITTIFTLSIISGTNILNLKIWRNFYGIAAIDEKEINNQKVKLLKHGVILHGLQILSNNRQNEPTAYFGHNTGIGLTILNNPKYKKGMDIGIIGLGVGTLAAYGNPRDNYTFYEINPAIIEIAKNEFTFLKNSKADIEIVQGDGRLSLAHEAKTNKNNYDLLIIDAFSDDSIPLHLLTKEAFEIYLNNINTLNGIIAINISNNYVDLKPPLIKMANHYKMPYVIILNKNRGFENASEWFILAMDKNTISSPEIKKAAMKYKNYKKNIQLWTDNYSNLFQVLK